jgi:hydrogenase-4 component F
MAAVFLALLADNLGIMWVAIEAATLLCVVDGGHPPHARRHRGRVEVLHPLRHRHRARAVRHHRAWRWRWRRWCRRASACPSPPAGAAPRADAGLLNLAFVFLLVGFGTKAGLGPLHSWLPDAHAEGPTPIAAVLSGLLLNAAMLGILRGKAIVAGHAEAIPPGWYLLGAGLLSLTLAALSLGAGATPSACSAGRASSTWASPPFAFGLGGPAGNMAGLCTCGAIRC